MVRNLCFRGTTTAPLPIRYEKFDLHKVELLRGYGLPILGTPLQTSNDLRLYYNTITALGFERGGNGITLEEYRANHFDLVFDLTATREASKSLTLSRIDRSRHNIEIVFQQSVTRSGRTILNWGTIQLIFH